MSSAPRARRIRLDVALRWPGGNLEGYTVELSRTGGFVACPPGLHVGDLVAAEVQLGRGPAPGTSLVGLVVDVIDVPHDRRHPAGVELVWTEVAGREGRQALADFLVHVLGEPVDELAGIAEDGPAPWRWHYVFGASAPVPAGRARAHGPAVAGGAARPGTDPHAETPTVEDLPADLDDVPTRVPPSSRPRPRTTPGMRKLLGRPRGRAYAKAPEPEPAARAAALHTPPDDALRPLADEPPAPDDRESHAPPPRLSAASTHESLVLRALGRHRSALEQARATEALTEAARDEAEELALRHRVATQPELAGVDALPPPAQERRSRIRVPVPLPLTYLLGAAEAHVGRCRDLSRSGILIDTEQTVPAVDTRVKVRLPILLPGGQHVVMLTGYVTRHADVDPVSGEPGAFAVAYTLVDELGVPGIFGHFLRSHSGGD